MATPPSSSHQPLPPEEEARDWAELPRDALLAVLHRLGHVDILMGPGQVCRPWRRAARDEPELWRRVDMRFRAGLSSCVDLHMMARAAVRRGSGRCEAFWGEAAVDDTVLSLLADSAQLSLKSLRLISCQRIYDWTLSLVITRFTLLEELELSNCRDTLLEELELSNCRDTFSRTCAAVGKSCPLLKRFRLSSKRFNKRDRNDIDGEAMAIATMRGLRSLQLFAKPLSNKGLVAILDGCARLESLDIRHCFNVEMNDEMRARCSRIETLRLPGDSTDDYDLEFSSPDMDPGAGSPQTVYYYEWEFSSR